ncbi:MAG: helix-turn-helix domain-containing protein [Acidobacteria bacterium]|nr:helix-turn-helix domain-containing protein [Acidobacteriota bacterium]
MIENQELVQPEIGYRIAQLREAASVKQAELAKRVTWSAAVVSRIESGERPVNTEELREMLSAIGTPEATKLSEIVQREWRVLRRPSLDHPDHDALWNAEQVCRELQDLQARPDIPHSFERRLAEYIDEIQHTANLLFKRDHQIAFIGSIGVGKSTAICKLMGLEVPSADGGSSTAPVIEVGAGGITICEVHLKSGFGYGLLIEPRSENEIRADVSDFAEHIFKGREVNSKIESTEAEEEYQGISKEIERAIRNMSGLKIRREKGPDGKTIRRDEAVELAARTASIREFVAEVLARMELHRRDTRDVWYDRSTAKSPLLWLKEEFEKVNNGRQPEFTLPRRIEIIVPDVLLHTNELSIRIVDTKGIDQTATRPDLENHLDEPHTLAVLCSGFNDAPSAASRLLLERAKAAGIRRLGTNVALLVLPHPNQALAVKDESGIHVETIAEGYELKGEQVAMALEPLNIKGIKIDFFNSFGDEPERLRNTLLGCLHEIREGFRAHLQEATADARFLILNREKEQVQEVVRSAARTLNSWINQHAAVGGQVGHIQESLMSQIRTAYASTIRATVRRGGEWHNLSYGHHLGYGARRLAVLALDPVVNRLFGAIELLEANKEYEAAKDLLQQVRRVLEFAYEETLRKSQIMGQNSFKEALGRDLSLWSDCNSFWGQGPGYRNRVALRNQDWFDEEARKNLEREVWNLIAREWTDILKRLVTLLDVGSVHTSLEASLPVANG